MQDASLKKRIFVTTLKVQLVLSFFISSAFGFINIRTQGNGAAVQWPQGSLLEWRANTANSSGLSAQDVFNAFSKSLLNWRFAAHNGFSFIYYQGTDTSIYPNSPGVSSNTNVIFFTSHSSGDASISCGVVALTELWFNPESGQASKAEMRYNDVCYQFTNQPSDTVSHSKIYLPDVATHEMGHALGLDHSQNLQSSLVFTAAIDSDVPSCDDQAAMVHLYAPQSVKNRTGSIIGKVRKDASTVFGAHVNLIHLERGTVMASTMSMKDGSFSVTGLEPGNYAVMIEPFYPGSSSLGPYYAGINNHVCGGWYFDRTFVHNSDGKLKSFFIGAGTTTNIGDTQVNCSAPTTLNMAQENSMFSAPVLAENSVEEPKVTQSVFNTSNDHYYKVANVSGRIQAHAMSYSLFSNADVEVELLDETGVRIPGQTVVDNVNEEAQSLYINYDSTAVAVLPSTQNVIVHVKNKGTIPTSKFPSGGTGLSSTPYYVLTVKKDTRADGLYPNHSSCKFTGVGSYPHQGDAPPLNSHPGGEEEDDGLFGCGTIGSHGSPFTSKGNLFALFNLTLVFLLVASGRKFLIST